MPGASLLTLLDDLATILDDVAVMSKVAAKKTAGVLGDDLALNAEQVIGFAAERELPVVWAVAKGSAVNKAILVPAALAISAFLPWAITPLLMMGGTYLCFEGFEKIAHKFLHTKQEGEQHHKELIQSVVRSDLDLVAFEKEKIRGAIRTDFILSAEIVVISLGVLAKSSFHVQVVALAVIAVIMTIGVYGLVAGIVKLDDLGLALKKRTGSGAVDTFLRKIGKSLLIFAPWLMKALSVVGTVAMFMVGGGIIVHGVSPIHHAIQAISEALSSGSVIGGVFGGLAKITLEAAIGVLTGALALVVTKGISRLRA